MTALAHALWRRLDTPGHDAARLVDTPAGARLEGAAAFRHESGAPARLDYVVDCDSRGRTRDARVTGWIGSQAWDVRVERLESGVWRLDGKTVEGVQDCVDVDFGFTPATNLLLLRRLALPVGQATDVRVAWLDLPDPSLVPLPQRYERRTAHSYWYDSPTVPYQAMLDIADSGFVRDYPGLWKME